MIKNEANDSKIKDPEVTEFEYKPNYFVAKYRRKHKKHYNFYYKLELNGLQIQHRIDGPSLEYCDESMKYWNEYWLNGRPLSNKEIKQLTKFNKMSKEKLLYHLENNVASIILEEKFNDCI